jgi:hypothetical protein
MNLHKVSAVALGLLLSGSALAPMTVEAKKKDKSGESISLDGGATNTGSGIFLTSDTNEPTSSIVFEPKSKKKSESLTFAGIETLSATVEQTSMGSSSDEDSFGGGSPRFQVTVDENGNGELDDDDGNVFIYLGTPPNFTDDQDTYSSGNLIEANDLRFDTSQVGGTFYDTYDNAVDLVGDTEVLEVRLVVDSSFADPGDNELSYLVTSFSVNDVEQTGELPTSKNDCKKGGFKSFINPDTGNTFKNQGQCEKFVKAND